MQEALELWTAEIKFNINPALAPMLKQSLVANSLS